MNVTEKIKEKFRKMKLQKRKNIATHQRDMAYALVNLENGFAISYLEVDATYKGPIYESDFKIRKIREDNYGFAMHSNVWKCLSVPQKLAVLILMEKDLAKRANRDNVVLATAVVKKGDYALVENDKKVYYCLDVNVVEKMKTVVRTYDNLTKTERKLIFEKYGQNAMTKYKGKDIPLITKEYVSAYEVGQMIIEMSAELNLVLNNQEYLKTKKVKDIETNLLIINESMPINLEQISEIYIKNGRGYLTDDAERLLCAYYCQPRQIAIFKRLEFLKDIVTVNESNFWGLQYTDPDWIKFKSKNQQIINFREKLIKHHYKDKDRIEIYLEGYEELQKILNNENSNITEQEVVR